MLNINDVYHYVKWLSFAFANSNITNIISEFFIFVVWVNKLEIFLGSIDTEAIIMIYTIKHMNWLLHLRLLWSLAKVYRGEL